MPERVRMALIGCGNMGRNHLRDILKQQDTTEIVALCDIAPEAIEKAAEIFDQAGVPMPPSEPRLDRLLANHALDAVFIVSPRGSLQSGQGLSGGRSGRAPGEANGDERAGGAQPH